MMPKMTPENIDKFDKFIYLQGMINRRQTITQAEYEEYKKLQKEFNGRTERSKST
jgi:hypothetical protein